MAVYTVTHQMRLDDYAVVQTLESTEIGIGQEITLSGLGYGLDGAHTVLAVPTFLYTGTDTEGDWIYNWNIQITNQLLFASSGTDVERAAVSPFGLLTWTQTCTWVTASDVMAWLGITVATANDQAFVTTCTEAANAWAYKARKSAGYQAESLTTAPSSAVELGTTMYAAALYRERGSVDSFSSFTELGAPAQTGSMGQIMRLLGIRRAQVA